MGLCNSTDHLTTEERLALEKEKQMSKELDKKMKAESLADNHINKLLLLGAGESGKSTLFKQMITIYKKGFSEEERQNHVAIVYVNVITSMKVLCGYCVAFTEDAKYPDAVACQVPDDIATIEALTGEEPVDAELAQVVKRLWADPGIQYTFENRSRFQLLDSAPYFFNKVDEVSQPGYLPSDQDMLRSRVRTTGIVENNFKIQDSEFKMFDVGGQRSERKKWIHCFEEVTAIIFVAAISEYDQTLWEDETTNRMTESLNLFEEICNMHWFKKTSIILFLNKRDLFEEKIKKVSLTKCFGDAYDLTQFEDYSYDDGCYFIEQQFKNRNESPQKVIYAHITTATDTGNISHVFNTVKDIVIRDSLTDSGLV